MQQFVVVVRIFIKTMFTFWYIYLDEQVCCLMCMLNCSYHAKNIYIKKDGSVITEYIFLFFLNIFYIFKLKLVKPKKNSHCDIIFILNGIHHCHCSLRFKQGSIKVLTIRFSNLKTFFKHNLFTGSAN